MNSTLAQRLWRPIATIALATVAITPCVAQTKNVDPVTGRDPADEAKLLRLSEEGTEVGRAFQRAEDLMLDGELDLAENTCLVAMDKYPDLQSWVHLSGVEYMGEILLQKGAYTDALGQYHQYDLTKPPTVNPKGEATMALCYLKLGNTQAAQNELLLSAQRSPKLLSDLLGEEHVPDISGSDPGIMEGVCHLIRATSFANSIRKMQVHLAELKVAQKLLAPNRGVDEVLGQANFDLYNYVEAKKLWEPIIKAKDAFLIHKIGNRYNTCVKKLKAQEASKASTQAQKGN